ncbi:helix-turn-helix transcriptional regulator [Kribbella sp. CA-294648]|uniref:helix-turn-helix transcriptional regulator n=1 Tax=Kribbella sp. CA-294648 TaxID=3239948 RepID=UPI003D8A9438
MRPELGEYLQSRRARVSPEEAGLPNGAARRVPGLRREEVAMLANVSVDYYIRLEQGRAGNPSETVLGAVADALRLTAAERAHLFSLAAPSQRTSPPPAEVRPQLAAMIQALRDVPAIVVDRLTNVLAWNDGAALILADFAELPVEQRNLTRMHFLDPAMRDLHGNWEQVARDAVAQLRHASVGYASDPEMAALVSELSSASPEFAAYWNAHDVATRSPCAKVLNHPTAGRLSFSLESLVLPADDGQYVMTYTPTDEPTRTALLAAASAS